MPKVSGPFCKVSFAQVSITSPVQVKEFLLEQGWVPDSFTPKGSPQLTESSYPTIKNGVGQLIAKRAVLKHRAGILFGVRKKDSKLTGWLNSIREDGRLEAGAMTNGTNTGRMMHRVLVNVPQPTDELWESGTQIRSLITCPDDKELMGIDADSLEAMIEAHCCLPYPNGVEYSKDLTSGKLHDNNATMLGVSRKVAKGFKYAVSYGAQPKKLSEVVGCSEAKAKKLFNAFWKNNTALDGFKKAITKYWKTKGGKKYIKGIDGRKIWARSEHSLVNLYFQSTGSIAVKVAMLFTDKGARQKGLKSQQIMSMHDEYTYELHEGEKDAIMKLAEKSFIQASKWLELRVTITGSPATGKDWEEIH